jgi:hypothetical protein
MGYGRTSSVPWPAAAMAAVLVLASTGCTAPGELFGTGYTVAADDSCGTDRQQLKSFQDYFFASMVQGAAIGAAGGALLGYGLGGGQGALIGAGAGALAGGATGYYLAKEKANSDPAALTNSVYQDVSQENSQIDSVSLAFQRLKDCRLRSASAVKSDYRAKKITLDDAQARLQRIKALFLQDVAFAEGLGKKMDDRGAQYEDASNQIVKVNPNAKETASAREASGNGGPAAAGTLVANQAARVRGEASSTGKQLATLTPGEAVTPIADEAGAAPTPAEWTHVQMKDGRSGYVSSPLLRPAGTAAPGSRVPPPHDAAGVAQLTDSNQLKRKALTDEVAEAKNQANGGSFELQGNGISRAPAPRDAA